MGLADEAPPYRHARGETDQHTRTSGAVDEEPLVEGTMMAKVEPWRRTQKELCGSEENLLRATAMG